MHFKPLRASVLVAAIMFVAQSASWATVVGGTVGTISAVWSYTDFGTGDVVIIVANPLATCQQGFWLRMTDVGAKQTYAMILTYQAMGLSLNAYGYVDQLWSGTSGRYCRLQALSNVAQ